MTDIFEELVNIKKNGEEGVLLTVVNKDGHGPAGVGTKMLIKADGTRYGTIGGGALEYAAIKKAAQVLKDKHSHLKKYLLSQDNDIIEHEKTGMLCGGTMTLFYEYIGSGVKLYIFGAGHIGQAIVSLLDNLNYYTTILDSRDGMAEAIQGAQQAKTVNYETVFKGEAIPPGGFFIIATHSHALDFQLLKRIYELRLDPKYIGLIASRKKAREITERLTEDIECSVDLDLLYAPMGLNIGGRTPHEIAFSIISELQAIRYGKEGHKHMRDK